MISNRNKRIQEILKKVKLQKNTTIDELAELFEVSSATIRRDLKQLEEEKIIIQTVGGGVMLNSAPKDSNIQEEATSYINEKIRIAEYCIELVNDYDDIIIGPGTTTYLVGKILSGITDKNFRIITNSLELGVELSGINNIQVVIPGGTIIDKHTMTFEDYPDFFTKYKQDHKTIISVDGVDVKNGLTVFHPQYVPYMKKIIDISSEVILVANSRKFGKSGFYNIAGLDKIHRIITDKKLDEDIRKKIIDLGIKLVTV